MRTAARLRFQAALVIQRRSRGVADRKRFSSVRAVAANLLRGNSEDEKGQATIRDADAARAATVVAVGEQQGGAQGQHSTQRAEQDVLTDPPRPLPNELEQDGAALASVSEHTEHAEENERVDGEPANPRGEEGLGAPVSAPGDTRLDPDDGEQYTQAEFIEIYGGSEEWDAVALTEAPAQPAPASEPAATDAAAAAAVRVETKHLSYAPKPPARRASRGAGGRSSSHRPLSGPARGLSTLCVSRSKLSLCGGFVWARWALNGPEKRRFSTHDHGISSTRVGWLMRWVGWFPQKGSAIGDRRRAAERAGRGPRR
jgi:hypothetical protein